VTEESGQSLTHSSRLNLQWSLMINSFWTG
jgi:hypothetical protein